MAIKTMGLRVSRKLSTATPYESSEFCYWVEAEKEPGQTDQELWEVILGDVRAKAKFLESGFRKAYGGPSS